MPTKIISNNTTGVGTGDYSGTPDVKIRLAAPTTNYDGFGNVEVSKWAAGDHTHGLFTFAGLSNITGPVVVSSITLGIYQESATGTYAIDVRRVLRNWVEAEATWNNYSTAGGAWTTAGCLSDGNDRVGATSGQFASFGTGVGFVTVTQTSGGLVDDVQGWINGTFSNYGWHLMRSDAGEDATSKVFTSTLGTDGNKCYLSVTYTTGTDTVIAGFGRRLRGFIYS